MSLTNPFQAGQTLRLEPVAGPSTGGGLGSGYTITPEKPVVIGRAVGSDICLLHEGVSRRHAMIQHKHVSRHGVTMPGTGSGASVSGGRWYVIDLGSSPGTYVGGVRLAADVPAALVDGDLLRIGPWTFRVMIAGSMSSRSVARTLAHTMDDDVRTGASVVAASLTSELRGANERLDQLIECTLKLMDAGGESEMARVVLEAAIGGTGFSRGAVLTCPAEDGSVQVVHGVNIAPSDWKNLMLSRSLVKEAAHGRVATLMRRGSVGEEMVSERTINELRIHSAVCAPVLVGSAVVALMYLDARGEESRVQQDAESFCGALARMYGMAIGSAMRNDIEQRRAALESDLSAAREAQQLILPPPDATLGMVRYSVRNVPGRFVAGDLFDAIDLGDGRVAITIGDVSGEGAGSAILMASTQAYLHAMLRRTNDLAAAVQELNRYVCQHSPLDRFVSAWVGLFDSRAMTLTHVDAGHGHWMFARRGEEPEAGSGSNGIPLGIEPEFAFASSVQPVGAGDRVLLYSDGLLEQTSPAGEEFGTERIAAMLRGAMSAEAAADALMRGVQQHTGRPFLDDDTTVASVEIVG